MRICRIIFSTNRIGYLTRTLESFRKLDFGAHEVYSIFIDDYPRGRDDQKIQTIAKYYGFDRVILHPENLGLSRTWAEFNGIVKDMDFDYVWHQEDDVELLAPFDINVGIRLLQSDPTLCQVSLKRQPWYFHEQTTRIEEDDQSFEGYRYNRKQFHFWTMASLYPHRITTYPYMEYYGYNPSEAVVFEYLREHFNAHSAVLKNADGAEMVYHIGEYTQGKRVEENEPGWQNLNWMDPNKRYSARNGRELGDGELL
jgi:hypothetical protein